MWERYIKLLRRVSGLGSSYSTVIDIDAFPAYDAPVLRGQLTSSVSIDPGTRVTLEYLSGRDLRSHGLVYTPFVDHLYIPNKEMPIRFLLDMRFKT